METSFHALEIASATFMEMKDPVGRASSSFVSLKSAKLTIEEGKLEGWVQIIDVHDKKDCLGLRYVPSTVRGALVHIKDNTQSIHEVFLITWIIHGDQVSVIGDNTEDEEIPCLVY